MSKSIRMLSVCSAFVLCLCSLLSFTAVAATEETVSVSGIAYNHSGGSGFQISVSPTDSLAVGGWDVAYAFTEGGLYLSDGTLLTNGNATKKVGNGVYYIGLADRGYTVSDGEILYLDAVIEQGDLRVVFQRAYFQYTASTDKWTIVAAPAAREETVSLSACISSNSTGLYFYVDPADSLPYDGGWSVQHTFTEGGLYKADGTLLSTATAKLQASLYYMPLSYTPADGDVIYVEGAILRDDLQVTYTRTYFRYDADGEYKWAVAESAFLEEEVTPSACVSSSATGLYFYVDPADSLPYDGGWSVQYTFAEGGLYKSDGTLLSTATAKLQAGLYYMPVGYTPADGDLIYLDGAIVRDGTKCVYKRTYFQYDADGEYKWAVAQPALEEKTITISSVGSSSASAMYFNVNPADPLPYNSNWDLKYTFDEGGLYLADGDISLANTIVKLQAQTYYVGLNYIPGDDEIIYLDGAVVHDGVKYVYTRTYFQYDARTSRWSVYDQPYVPDTSVGDKISVSLSNGVLTVTGTGTVKASDLQAYAVSLPSVRKIVIKAGVTAVAAETFVGMTSLTEVHTPNTLLTVADNAFVNCASGVILRYVADKPFTGGLIDPDIHPYYSFKMVTIGDSYGEDTNTYIYKLAKTYYANLAGRKAGDSAYDEIVVAELYTGAGSLQERVWAINGNPNKQAFYEKWSDAGISIPATQNGQLSAGLMSMALRDEYWDYVMLMQTAVASYYPESFTASTTGNGEADMDVMIQFAKERNLFGEHSTYLWLMTWSHQEKLANPDYNAAVAAEKEMREGIATSMQTVVQSRIDSGAIDAIVPAGAAMENLKTSYLNAEDPFFDHTYPTGNQTWNNGEYSLYFALFRDPLHASCGFGRFTVGLTAFSSIAGLTDVEIGRLSLQCFPRSWEEYEIPEKEINGGAVGRYLEYDTFTEKCALQAYSAAASAIRDPYNDSLVCMTGDLNNDYTANALDIVRYKRAAAGMDTFLDPYSADVNVDGNRNDADIAILRQQLLKSLA